MNQLIMSLIKQLSEEVILKIAAGEVIERPVSVVKELVENSIDADSKTISVEVFFENDCFDLKIVDDGCGMDKEDLELCFLRHATSKISDSDDLFNIHSLGFRGEALASIASISKLTLKSKKKHSDASILIVEGGIKNEIKPVAFRFEHGTEINIKDLFYNVPVRKKFLKTRATEIRQITQLISDYIFAYEKISFKLKVNGKTTISSPSGTLLDKFFHIYGKESKSMLELNGEFGKITVEGLISKPELRRKSRSDQIFFVNGRLVKSSIFYSAISNAYKGFINSGEYPVVILKIKIAPGDVDVNIHPTKQEVKFQDDSTIYRAIYHTILNKLNTSDLTNIIHSENYVQEEISLTEEMLKDGDSSSSKSLEKNSKLPSIAKKSLSEQTIFVDDSFDKQTDVNFNLNVSDFEFRIIGIFNNEFIVVEKFGEDSELVIIDFHAAAEIVNYEKLNDQFKVDIIENQALVEPLIIELSPAQVQLVNEHLNELKHLGFFVEEFGTTSFIIRTIPIIMGRTLDKDLFYEILSDFEGEKAILSTEKFKDKVITKMSCIASEKAGQNLSLVQAKKIVSDLLRLQKNKFNCPHGRPTMVQLSKKDLEKMFKRIL